MTKFLARIIYFLFILLVLNGIFWFTANKLYFKNYHNYSTQFNAYLLADSHGLPLKQLTEKYGVYNFSGGGDSFVDIKRKILFLLSKTTVKTIYLTVDDHTLSQYRERLNNSDRSLFFVTPKSCNNYYQYLKLRYVKYNLIFFQPGTRTVLKHYITTKINRFIFNDVNRNSVSVNKTWSDFSAEERKERAKRRKQRQYPSPHKSIKLHQSFKDIINICINNNIELVGVKFPLSSDYIKITKNIINYDAGNILKLYGFRVLNFKKVFIHQNMFFNNQDHLNEKGAQMFVKILFKNLKILK